MHEIDETIVRSYDIRGVYPDQLDEPTAYRLARAMRSTLMPRRVVLGWDARLSSPSLAGALAAGLRDAGAEVAAAGLCPTELIYYAAGAPNGFDLGIMVTASHNPPEYNGIKVVGPEAEPITGKTGLQQVVEAAARLETPTPDAFPEPRANFNAVGQYTSFAIGLVGAPDAGDLKAVVDAGNGVGGLLWDWLADRIDLSPVRVNCQPDGRFPAHHPDPTKQETLDGLRERVAAEKADLGFAYDGDADRVVVVLPDGHIVDGSEMSGCLAARMLSAHPDTVFGLAQTTSRKVLDDFARRGVEPVMVPVGHSKIKTILRAHSVMAFAGEDAGHYYYRDFFCCDSSLLTTLHVLHMAASGALRDYIDGLPGPWHRPRREPSFGFDDQDEALDVCRRVASAAVSEYGSALEVTCEHDARLERECHAGDIQQADGVRVDYEDWWFCVRPSGTEPIARLAVEARTQPLLDRRIEELSDLFDRFSPDIS